jgi:ribosome biogenesis GTPase
MDLAKLGWTDFFQPHFEPHEAAGLCAARVVTGHRGGWSELPAEVSGRFRYLAKAPGDFPAVGDWVATEVFPVEGKALIHAVLPRRTKMSRAAAGGVTDEQVLAANVDEVFLVASLGGELNTRRIERYLAVAWESGAQPVVVLTKADLCEDVTAAVRAVEEVAGGAAVHAVCALTGRGLRELKPSLRPAATVVLLGPSGVGKSTLINHLYGDEVLPTLPVREEDQKGRHTTTVREMIQLPSGALVIDTPGLRELGLWDGAEGVVAAFEDVEMLAARCRFTDCRHEAEPGCAVRQAVEDGTMEPSRLEGFHKLRRERTQFARRHDARAQAVERRRIKSATKHLRNFHRTDE